MGGKEEMQIFQADDIKQDAIRVLNYLSEEHKKGRRRVKAVPHFVMIKSHDPMLNNLVFYREVGTGGAHRDKYGVFLKSRTDLFKEMYNQGVSEALKVALDYTGMDEAQQTEVFELAKDSLPMLIAFVNAEVYDVANDHAQMFMLFHLLLHYKPDEESKKTRDHDFAIFKEDLEYFPDLVLKVDNKKVNVGGGQEELPEGEEEFSDPEPIPEPKPAPKAKAKPKTQKDDQDTYMRKKRGERMVVSDGVRPDEMVTPVGEEGEDSGSEQEGEGESDESPAVPDDNDSLDLLDEDNVI